jgi:membrane-associated phospholipid phosphatase
MRKPLFSWAGGAPTALPVTNDRPESNASAIRKFWRPLQNILIVAAAWLIPTALGLGNQSGFAVMSAMLLLVTYRSKCGPIARMAQFFYGYAIICALFGVIRGHADDAPWANAHLNTAFNIEKALFNDQLPSARLQRLFFEPGHISLFDYFITGVYISFFFVPVGVGVLVAFRRWQRSRRMLIAQMFVFAIGLLAITVWPSNPPWLTEDSALTPTSTAENRVYRVTTIALGQGDDYAYGADTNRVAAMPSIHLANTCMVLLVLWALGWKWRIAGGAYVATMGFAIVYLGEHYVIDAVMGVALALVSWQLACAWQRSWRDRLVTALQPSVAGLRPVLPRFARSAEVTTFPAVPEAAADAA